MQQEYSIETIGSLHSPHSYWQKTTPHPLFSSHLASFTDVLIIGGGLLGAATCYWLARTGCSVTVLERAIPAYGATGRNGGFVSIGPDEAYAQAITQHGYKTTRSYFKRDA